MPLLAQLVVEYVADVSKLTSGVNQAAKSMNSVNKSAESGAAALRNFAMGAAVLATTAIVGIGVASTKMAADFQSGMTSLVTGAGEAESNIKQVSDGILKMATDTGTSTKSLSDGMFMIESAGFHGANGLTVLKNAAMGAKVGNAELKDVANGVTTALSDYSLSADHSAEVTNTLIATVSSGKTTMGELSASLKDVLPIASSAGISLNGVSAAMATMTGEGVPAGQAANYLKGMILALQAPSSQGAKTLKSIGLSAQDVASAMSDSLPDALTMITDHLKTKFPEGSAAYTAGLKEITGGTESLAAVMDLTGTHMSTFKGNVDNIYNAVRNGGSSITGWSKVQQDFNFQVDKGKEVIETMGIKLGTALLPKVGELLSKIMPSITAFGNWLISSHALENAFTFLSNAVGGTISVVTNIVTFFQQNQAAFEALKIGAILLAGVFGGALVGAMILATIAAWNMAIAFLANPVVWIAIAIGAAIALIVIAIMHWGDIVAWLQGIWGAFSGWFMGILGAIGAFFVGLWQNLAAWFTGMWTGIVNGLIATWNFIVNIIKIGAMLALAVLFAPIVLMVAAFLWLYNHNYYFKALVDAIVGFFKFLFTWAVGAWGGFVGWLAGVWHGAVGIASAAWGAVSGAIMGVVGVVVGWLRGAWSAVIGWLGGVWGTLSGYASRAWGAVTGIFRGVWGTISGILGGLWNSFSTWFSNLAGQFLTWGGNVINGFIQGIKDKIAGIGTALAGAANTIKNFLGFHSPTKLGPGAEADKWAPNFVKMYAKGITDGIPQIQNAVNKLAAPIGSVGLNIKGASVSSAAKGGSSPLQGGNSGNQDVHVHVYWDGEDITDRVMTRAISESRGGGPIR